MILPVGGLDGGYDVPDGVIRLIVWPTARLTLRERLVIFFRSLRCVKAGQWDRLSPALRLFATDNARYVMRSSALEPIRERFILPLLMKLRLVTYLETRGPGPHVANQMSADNITPSLSSIVSASLGARPVQLRFFYDLVSERGGPTQVRYSSIFDSIDPNSHRTRFRDGHGALQPMPITYWVVAQSHSVVRGEEAMRFSIDDRIRVTGSERRGNLMNLMRYRQRIVALGDSNEPDEFDDSEIDSDHYHGRRLRRDGSRWDDLSSAQ